MDTKSNNNPNPIFNNTNGDNKQNHKRPMEKFKEAVIKFAHSNPSLFRDDGSNSYLRLIEQRFSQFSPDFQTPNHPPYAAMIHRAIQELNEKGGSSEESISKYIKEEYVDLPWAHSMLLKHHLEKLCDRKEICMIYKQCYMLAGADSDPISSSRSEKWLKRKQNSESGKKSSRHRKKRKKQKSRQDSELGKTSNRHHNLYKKKEEHQLDLQETNKQIVEVFQEQDQVLQLLNEVVEEQENITLNGLHEPQYLMIEDETYEQGNSLIDIFNQDMEESGVCVNAAEQNQSEIKKDGVGEKVYMITHIHVTGNENQSVERVNDKEQIEIGGTKKGQLKRKRMLKSKKRSSKRGKKHEINGETQLKVLSEATLKQHNEVTDSDSHEQDQLIEVNTIDMQIQEQNEVGKSLDAGAQNRIERRKNGVAEEVDKDGAMAQDLHPDNSGYISLGQIQMKQNPLILQLEESPDSNPILLESKHLGKRVWTRSQLKAMSKKDALASSELMESPAYANMPKDKFDLVEYLSEGKQLEIEIIGGNEAKEAPSAVSTQMNGQRAKLRSSKKNTGHLETVMESLDTPLLQMKPQPKSRSPGLERPSKELLNPICRKLRPQFPDLDEPTTAPSSTEVQEAGSSQQVMQSHAKYQQKYQSRCRSRKPENVKNEVFCASTSADIPKQGQQSNKEDQPKYKCCGRHKMTTRSGRKKKDPSR